MKDKKRVLLKVLPLLIILGAAAVMVFMIFFRPAPKKEIKENPGELAETQTITTVDHQIIVAGTGAVHARKEATITPQVSGKIIYVSDHFAPGGFFRKGQLMFEIEKVDYELAVERSKASLAQAELELAQEESNARIARMEWENLSRNNEQEPNPLVLYEPQLKRARANVASAKAELQQARLDLERTRVHAPFNCRIRDEEIDVGQYIRSGSNVAVVAGTDDAEIIVPLSIEELHWIRIPRNGDKIKGSEAIVKVTSGNNSYSWEGKVVRSLGEVDEKGRMARVVVVVQDPYRLNMKRINGEPDLEVGMFVEVDIYGEKLTDVVLLTRDSIREDNTVWIADEQDMLRIRPVRILRSEKENVIVRSGLSNGDRVVLTNIQGAADGMKLRLLEGVANQ
jgi:RND family efflux transporter MFP subunit